MILRRIQLIACLAALLLPHNSCSKGAEPGSGSESRRSQESAQTDLSRRQDNARKELGKRGIPYTEDAFLAQAANGETDVVELFLAAGMDPNTSETGSTALIQAALYGHLDTVTALLNKGADANAKLADGRTALLVAIQSGAYTEVVKVLLAQGADPNAKLNDGRTPLMLATDSPDIVLALLKKGADVRARDSHRGETPLKKAIDSQDVESVRALLSYDADVNTKDVDGYSALMQAAGTGQTGVVKLLLSKGVDVNARDNAGWTALMGAASDGNLAIVRALVANGADVNAEDKNRNTPRKLAKEKGHKEIAGYLEKAGAKR